MSDMRSYTTLLLPWKEIAEYTTAIVSSVLGRTVACLPNADSHEYWAIITRETPLSNVEIAKLVRYVDGDPEMLKRALPAESNVTRSVEMCLSEALLRDVLKLDWERSFITDEGLWLLGHFSENFKPPAAGSDLLYVDGKVVDCSKLMSMKEFVDTLFEEGGTLTEFTKLCEQNHRMFGTPLYWVYPLTDGSFNGCYFVAVREGILAISYDMIDCDDHEVFEKESARLCSAEELGWFLADWKRFSGDTETMLGALHAFQMRKETKQ